MFRTRGLISAITGRIFAAGSYEGSFKCELETFRKIAERESALAVGAVACRAGAAFALMHCLDTRDRDRMAFLDELR